MLENCSVSVGGVLAPLLYVSSGQVNFQVPSSLQAGDVNLVVNGPGGASKSFSVSVTAQAPAIFQNGTNHAVAQNADGTLNSDSAPAAGGSVITVYMTGQGAVDNPVPDGTATPASPLASAKAAATATIGAQSASIQFLGLTPGDAGLAQANIQVPALPPGDYPLVIAIGGPLSASAVVSVSGSGAAYTSPLVLAGSASFANSDTSRVVLFGNIAYVCGDNRIVMVDVTTAAAPKVIGEFGGSVLNGEGDRCVINDQVSPPYLVEIIGASTASRESLAVYSLGNPASPALLTVANLTYGHLVDLSFSGSFGYATTSYITYSNSNSQIISQAGDFLVFDFSNPATPLLFAFLVPSTLPGSSNQHLKPDASVVDQVYVYVTSSTATGSSTTGTGVLDVINVISPNTPLPISEVSIPQAAILLSFDVSGNILLAAGNTAGQRNPGLPDFDFTGNLTLTTMNLSNAQFPTVISTVITKLQVNGTFHTAAFNNGIFAIVNNPPISDDFGPPSLMIADARNPANILLYPFQTQFGFSGLLTTSNGYLLAPTSLGLNIYKLTL